MKVLFYAWILFVAVKGDETEEVYTKNNPYELEKDKVFYPYFGQYHELYKTDGVIRNIHVPPSRTFFRGLNISHPDPDEHPPIYFNLYKNGKNEGIFLLKNKVARKIKDGTDCTSSYTRDDYLNYTGIIYISTNDGIYTYNTVNEEIIKYGNITEEFKTIVKMSSDTDEIYVLAADNKIYKITSHGTVKSKVDGIDYAKDFIIYVNGDIFFLDEDNKPCILYKDSTKPVKLTGLYFDVHNVILLEQPWNFSEFKRHAEKSPFIVDGVQYYIRNNSVRSDIVGRVVEGLTAYNVEWSFINIYGEKGRMYIYHCLARHAPPSVQQDTESSKDSRKLVFDRDVNADYNAMKTLFEQ